MASSSGQSAHSALLALERSDALSNDLLPELVEILQVDLEALTNNFCAPKEVPQPGDNPEFYETPLVPAFAPREEWALRWMLKKAMSPTNHHHLFLLFHHLLTRVPIKRVATLFREHSGPLKLSNCLIGLVKNHEHMSHKPEVSFLLACRSIQRSLCYCLKCDDHQMRLALSMPASLAARTLGVIFHFHAYFSLRVDDPFGVSQAERLELLATSMQLWELRDRDVAEDSSKHVNLAFNKYCLIPLLINFPSTRWMHKAKFPTCSLDASIQRNIFLHTLLPVRQLFVTELAGTWKLDQGSLDKDKITSSAKAFVKLMFPECSNGGSRQIKYSLGSLPSEQFLPIILDIALKTVEHESRRHASMDREWFHALLLWLVRLPETLPSYSHTKFPVVRFNFTVLRRMLDLLQNRGVSLPLPVVAYLFDCASNHDVDPHLMVLLLDRLMDFGAGAFVPRSDLSTASRQSAEIFERAIQIPEHGWSISHESSWASVFGKLIRAYASGRELPLFIDTWMAKMRDASEEPDVWDSQMVIAALTRIVRTLDTSVLLTSHMEKTVRSLEDPSNDANLAPLLYWLDILVVGQDIDAAISPELVHLLDERIRGALPRSSQRSRTSGWLWRLHRHLLPRLQSSSLMLMVEVYRNFCSRGVLSKLIQSGKLNDSAYFNTMEPFADVEAICWLMSATALNLTPEATVLVEDEVLTCSQLAWPVAYPYNNLASSNRRSGGIHNGSEMFERLAGILLYHSSLICLLPSSATALFKVLDEVLKIGPEFVENASGAPHTALVRLVQPQMQRYEDMDSAEYESQLAYLEQYPPSLMSKAHRKRLAVAKEQKMHVGSKQKTMTTSDMAFQWPWAGYEKLRNKCVWSLDQIALDKEAAAASSNQLSKKDDVSVANLIMLGAMLYKGHTNGVDVQKAAIFLCEHISRVSDLTPFCLTVDCLMIILNKHASAITQWLIDSLLNGIIASFSSARLAHPYASPLVVYDRLCRLVGIVLARHRVRLGGRFHLLIPVLSGLLRCLFAPKITLQSSKSDRDFSATLPPWAALTYKPPPWEPKGEGISKQSASTLARILGSVADPSPSAVKTSKNNSLNDETRRARRIAGEHMQYLIAEYTRCCLEGSILPETKEALMPGLYKVLDGMDREVMRAMNARLDGSQKAIWRALYQDWERFGKWDGK